LIGDEGYSSDRKVPMVRIPDELLRSILGLLQAYEDRNNPSPTAEDIALRLGESLEVVIRACRKLEISRVVVVSSTEETSAPTYSLITEGKSRLVPEELLNSVMELVQTYEDRSNPAPTAKDMASGLGLDLKAIKLACSALEADGRVRATHTSKRSAPGYAIAGNEAINLSFERVYGKRATEPEVKRNKLIFAFLRSTARVFKSDLGIDVRLNGGVVRMDDATTEDVSVFMRVSGEFNGSVYYGLDRAVAVELVAIVRRRPASGMSAESLKILNDLVGQIGGQVQREFASAGYRVDISPASTIQPAGMRISSNGVPQVVTTLKSPMGPIAAHVSLFTSDVESAQVA
jgi:CheY-specific phosphatase CheX